MSKKILLVVLVAVIAFTAGYLLRRELGTTNTEPSYEYFAIKTLNPNTYKPNIPYYIRIPNKIPLQIKLENLAEFLSWRHFGTLPIDVVEIVQKNGKRTAIVNLREREEGWRSTWRTGYFQGSAGGISTSFILSQTFLQHEYKGEWVDCVRFLYEGELISSYRWDHMIGINEDNQNCSESSD